MQRFRNHSVLAAWLILCAIVLGGGLIEVHSHDELVGGMLSSGSLSCGHDLPDTTEHVESPTSVDDDFCPACTVGQREGVLDASHPSSRLLVMAAQSLRTADDRSVSGSDALPPAPRGPPTV